jgi:hypothetical protein
MISTEFAKIPEGISEKTYVCGVEKTPIVIRKRFIGNWVFTFGADGSILRPLGTMHFPKMIFKFRDFRSSILT